MELDWLPIEVWDMIFDFLSDEEIIAVNVLSKEIRNFFDNAVLYTQRFQKRWLMLNSEMVDVFEFDSKCITRDTYIQTCIQFYEWKKNCGLLRDDVCDVKLCQSSGWSEELKGMWQVKYSLNSIFGITRKRYESYDLHTVPTNWFGPLYKKWMMYQRAIVNHLYLLANHYHRAGYILNEPVREDRINNALIRELTGDDRNVRNDNRAVIQRQADTRVHRAQSHREFIGMRAYRDTPKIRQRTTNYWFPSKYERRLARQYLRMRYLERHGQLVIYNRNNKRIK